jgi:hypothetical protein
LEEEQEKELSPETQEERQLQKPPLAVTAKHDLHPDILEFAATAVAVNNSMAYQPAFTSLRNVSAAGAFDVHQLIGNGILYATTDFIHTVEPASGSHVSDSYLQAVQWILVPTTPTEEQTMPALIVSPYEAQRLMARLRTGSATALHIFKPYWSSGLLLVEHQAKLYSDALQCYSSRTLVYLHDSIDCSFMFPRTVLEDSTPLLCIRP